MVARIVREFGGILVATTSWPVILMEFPEKRLQDSDFHQSLAYIEHLMRECAAKREKSYQVTDLTRIQEIAPATQRKYAGDFLERNSSLSQTASLGTASVTPSSILRGILTAIFWISPPPTPAEFFATRDEAFLHAIGTLERARVTLPPWLQETRDVIAARRNSRAEKRASV